MSAMYEAETIARHTRQIADDFEKNLERPLEYWSDVISQRGSDGREILIALRDIFMRALVRAGGERRHAHAMVDGYDGNDSPSKISRQSSLLVSPNGRPLTKIG